MSTGELVINTKQRTQEEIDYIINNYEYRNDKIMWKNGPRKGRPVGCVLKDGYRMCKLNLSEKRVAIYSHQIVWFLVNGEWPKMEMDHINGIKDDNRIENLRQVTRNKNIHNNKSSKCYWWKEANKKYEACVTYLSKKHYLGLFETEDEARLAVETKSKELYGSYSKFYDTKGI